MTRTHSPQQGTYIATLYEKACPIGKCEPYRFLQGLSRAIRTYKERVTANPNLHQEHDFSLGTIQSGVDLFLITL